MTDRELIQQALDALEQWNTPLYKRGNIINTLRERLAPKAWFTVDEFNAYALRDRLEQPVQVPVAEFVEMVSEKEHLVGKPLVWAQWPNEEKK